MLADSSCLFAACPLFLLLISPSDQISAHVCVVPGIFLCAGLLITAGYSLGFGPVCWVLQSECFPTAIRGRCMALSVLVSNLGACLCVCETDSHCTAALIAECPLECFVCLQSTLLINVCCVFLNSINHSFFAGQFVMNLVFPPLMGAVGTSWIFGMFLLISFLALLFVSAFIVETKGKQPREILEAM
jgi:hypothetical protein